MDDVVQTGVPSNKPVIITTEHAKSLSSKEILKLDKLNAVLAVKDPDQQDELMINLHDCEDDSLNFIKPPKRVPSRFRTRLLARCSHFGWVLIEADPFKHSDPFLRVEFNPSDLGPEGTKRLKKTLGSIVPGGYDAFLAHGRVTRYDVALDVEVNINDLRIVPNVPLRSTIIRDAKGRIETIYLGSSSSSTQWRIYDKALQTNLPDGQELTRFERVQRTYIPLTDLPTVKNPFLQLSVQDLAAQGPPKWVEPWVWRLFQAACRDEGANATVAAMPKAYRIKFRSALKLGAASWWTPDAFWHSWASTLDDLGLLKPSGLGPSKS
jgi:hypothetical protein